MTLVSGWMNLVDYECIDFNHSYVLKHVIYIDYPTITCY